MKLLKPPCATWQTAPARLKSRFSRRDLNRRPPGRWSDMHSTDDEPRRSCICIETVVSLEHIIIICGRIFDRLTPWPRASAVYDSKYKQYKVYGKFEVLSPVYRRSFVEEKQELNNEADRLLTVADETKVL